jgi:hypothetical protein
LQLQSAVRCSFPAAVKIAFLSLFKTLSQRAPYSKRRFTLPLSSTQLIEQSAFSASNRSQAPNRKSGTMLRPKFQLNFLVVKFCNFLICHIGYFDMEDLNVTFCI